MIRILLLEFFMTEDSTYSEFRFTLIGTAFLSLVLFLSCLCAVLFFPVQEPAVVAIEDDSAVEAGTVPFARNVSYTGDFLTGSDNSPYMAGVDGLYLQDFISGVNAASGDAGLDYYRNPQTRGAVELFYLRVTGNRNVTFAILEAANRENIPLSLAFSLAYTESRFNSRAVNRNVNGSIDRGLFQLNDRTFPQLETADFFSLQVSAQYGMKHLRFCRSVANDDLVAVAMYNAGITRVKENRTPKSTLSYVSNIAKYRARLDAEFERDVIRSFEAFPDSAAEKDF